MEEIDGIEVDLDRLPDGLRHLAPLIRQFAIADDVIRSERMEAALDTDRARLAALSSAEWQELEQFIDEHMDANPGSPEQDLALVLSAFGEAAAEAVVDRERQGSS